MLRCQLVSSYDRMVNNPFPRRNFDENSANPFTGTKNKGIDYKYIKTVIH